MNNSYALKSFPVYYQKKNDCGIICLKMIAKYYGINFDDLFEKKEYGKTNLADLIYLADRLGLNSLAVKLSFTELSFVPLPCIIHWYNNHFVVLFKIENNVFFIANPAFGIIELKEQDFVDGWIKNNNNGYALLIELL